MNEKILVVEDEPAIRELVSVNLRHNGFRVTGAADVPAARSLLELERPDLVILDWMLPGQTGLDLAQFLRSHDRTRQLPIIMLTARAQEGDKLQGFEAGADDYLTKPFSPRELVARIRALLRRAGDSGEESESAPIDSGGLRYEQDSHRVYANDRTIELSPTEFKLLGHFMRNPERVLSRAKLLDKVWGDGVFVDERTVDVHIRRLRIALGREGKKHLIETVRGGGYRFSAG